MLLLGVVLVGLGAGIATGGRIGNLANMRFRWPFFVLAVLLIREAAVTSPLNRVEGVQYVYTLSLAGLVGWTVWHFGRLPGVWLVTAGAAMNLIAVIANGGRMPVSLELAGRGSHLLVDRGVVGQYVLMGPDTHLNWLADWIGLPGPLVDAYSPGDLLVAVGVALVAFHATRRRPEPELGETSRRIVSDPP
ncbi:hypothetical protein EPN29_13305 [bacterium]|nr:MAG: hypothetical protein EPN29_13305 [bacterium]